MNTELNEIRKIIGLCNQHDVLYENLSFEEHLIFIGRIKGMEKEDLEKDIENILETTNTRKEINKKARDLSGGNKRKLSLGMALIGGSKIIFLDEPTSGMDAISRRDIWKILE